MATLPTLHDIFKTMGVISSSDNEKAQDKLRSLNTPNIAFLVSSSSCPEAVTIRQSVTFSPSSTEIKHTLWSTRILLFQSTTNEYIFVSLASIDEGKTNWKPVHASGDETPGFAFNNFTIGIASAINIKCQVNENESKGTVFFHNIPLTQDGLTCHMNDYEKIIAAWHDFKSTYEDKNGIKFVGEDFTREFDIAYTGSINYSNGAPAEPSSSSGASIGAGAGAGQEATPLMTAGTTGASDTSPGPGPGMDYT